MGSKYDILHIFEKKSQQVLVKYPKIWIELKHLLEI